MNYRKHSSIAGRNESILLIIDVQDKLYDKIVEKEKLLSNIKKLVSVAKILGIPIIVTEQERLGDTIELLKKVLGNDYSSIKKISFSCMDNEEFRKKIKELCKKRFYNTFIVAGIEAHICVEQTALDLLANDYKVHVVKDAISSRRKEDVETAISKMEKNGIIVTSTEMVIYELLGSAGNEDFKKVLKIIKS
ncbi:MAG: isochorismatase family protein [Candidatus Parvarchaeota archaeon]|nr:isochorismatase family protein [Candidatus Jingweiarchaeum tengchongense]MCW1305034.1 isochorismatase family protein [Candidatus Jingweiarchaeum tengchongense]MCW1305475.1 isochorismatase family protein [Candidatus Jingweiarchaeum tengchongense]MCW1309919.1 isochorismatase family protein [Candidatus Jingweiarchaeum tengchongense]